MKPPIAQCLILACGNRLRGDDGVGPWVAGWAADRFCGDPRVRVVACHQWTPELAHDIARTVSVIFVDCAIDTAPGSVCMGEVQPSAGPLQVSAHHMDSAQLLALTLELYNVLPRAALQLTVGAGSMDLGEQFSSAVQSALPAACDELERAVLHFLAQ